MNNPGACVETISDVGGATTIEPAKSIASPGDVGSKIGGPSQSIKSGVSGISHKPFVPKMVPAATRPELSGVQIAPCGKRLVPSLNPLILFKSVPSERPTQRLVPASALKAEFALLPSTNVSHSPSGDHAGQLAPDTPRFSRCLKVRAGVVT